MIYLPANISAKTAAYSDSKSGKDKSTMHELEEALLETEEWLRLATQGSQLGLWHWDEVRQKVYWDAKTREMFGAPDDGEVTLQTFIDALHPDDRDRVMRTWRLAFEKGVPYAIDLRSLRPDGSVRWMYARGSGHYDAAGKPLSMIGVVFDVTERKEAEQEREELSRRLIDAQEQERSHVARELHDDFGQRLAILANDLERLAEMLEDSPTAAKRAHELWNDVSEIGADLHTLSHRLHSCTLEVLGLTRGIASLCAELSGQYSIEIQFQHVGVPRSIPSESALGLFRIVQEGLQNVIKHSGASRAEVQLKGSTEGIYLTLSDNGIGFDLSKSSAAEGIGIRGMKERALMLGGRLTVRSQPMQGTRIIVTVPPYTVDTCQPPQGSSDNWVPKRVCNPALIRSGCGFSSTHVHHRFKGDFRTTI